MIACERLGRDARPPAAPLTTNRAPMLLSRLRVGPKPKPELPPGPRAATGTCLSLMVRCASADARQLTIQLRARCATKSLGVHTRPSGGNPHSPTGLRPLAGTEDQSYPPSPGHWQVRSGLFRCTLGRSPRPHVREPRGSLATSERQLESNGQPGVGQPGVGFSEAASRLLLLVAK